MLTPEIRAMRVPYRRGLTLPLLVAGVRTDDQHAPVATDDLALLTHWLDRRSYLHADSLSEFEDISFWILGPALATAAVAATAPKRHTQHRKIALQAHRGMVAGVFR